MVPTYPEARNELVSAANSVDYAHPETGEGPVPLVLLQHFRAAEADRRALPIWRDGLLSLVQNARGALELDRGCHSEAYEQLRCAAGADWCAIGTHPGHDMTYHHEHNPTPKE